MSTWWHFPIFVAVSFVAFIGVLMLSVRGRGHAPTRALVVGLALVVVVGGMTFAKLGTSLGLPVWIYYGVPAALTWLLPPLALRMSRGELLRYLPMALLMAPLIHVVFSIALGWKEYMPFLPVPSLPELLG